MMNYLINQGYTIERYATTTQTGIDIEAFRAKQKICIEAKGATSSMEDSARYGMPFNDNQVKNHIGKAVVAALKVLNQDDKHTISAIALPDNSMHKKQIDQIQRPLKQLGIKVFLVSKDSVLDYF
ncbi:hypothetical protein JZO86_12385 [Enterococcus ureasiticus]|uniref:hypothetical protein n=1 Tax=Enterococcus ureasiticus TaxID=903984 RepID=UPI001A90223E|nr:hypothetical protein [Enterococcus ureasiticus]MBO0474496.1 hypothetical protein [Enterococcus ureasiticus]